MPSTSNRLVVVGGGLVGSLLAIYLARRGYRVDVFERNSDARGDEGEARRPSVNLTLCARGLAALAKVGLEHRALALAVPARGRRIHALDGDVSFQPYGNRGEAIHSIPRRALNTLLVQAAAQTDGVRFHFEEKCIGVDAKRGIARFAHVRTGRITETLSTRIFGADGAYSGVRLQLQKTELFDYSQQYSSQGYKELLLPVDEDGEPQLALDALHIWPRGDFMLMGFPNRDGSFTCAFYGPFSGEHSFETLTDEASVIAFMHDFFPDVAGLIPRLAEQFLGRPATTMVTVRCRPWSQAGNVLLVGDAAHSVLPSYGQGANAGFEDVAVLDRCLDAHGDDWHRVFTELERLRRPHMDVMADLCVDHFLELRDHVGDPRFLLRKAVERRLQELFPDRFAPLYSLVAFTCTPYSDAVRMGRAQSQLVDRLLELDGIEGLLRGNELATIVEGCMREVA